MKRSAQTHVCPAFRNFEEMALETAISKSASSNTIKAAFPPSSFVYTKSHSIKVISNVVGKLHISHYFHT